MTENENLFVPFTQMRMNVDTRNAAVRLLSNIFGPINFNPRQFIILQLFHTFKRTFWIFLTIINYLLLFIIEFYTAGHFFAHFPVKMPGFPNTYDLFNTYTYFYPILYLKQRSNYPIHVTWVIMFSDKFKKNKRKLIFMLQCWFFLLFELTVRPRLMYTITLYPND